MTRPTFLTFNPKALQHNAKEVKALTKEKKMIAMVKADAYGCGIDLVVPTLFPWVEGFGVASVEEAYAVSAITQTKPCIVFSGVFSPDELELAAVKNFQCVIHTEQQLRWLLTKPLPHPLTVWIKVDTGMHRLGFTPEAVFDILKKLLACEWVNPKSIGLLSHFSCADDPKNIQNQQQISCFKHLKVPAHLFVKSMANSAAIFSFPEAYFDVVRPGIMLYGASPFETKTASELNLLPVTEFYSKIIAIHTLQPGEKVGYGGTWEAKTTSRIGVIPLGYGDGYPRYIEDSKVWVNQMLVPIVGRVSMDLITLDLTGCPSAKEGDQVELWGNHLPIEHVARSAKTIAYELLTRITSRVPTKWVN